jgi:hypothetical protein
VGHIGYAARLVDLIQGNKMKHKIKRDAFFESGRILDAAVAAYLKERP